MPVKHLKVSAKADGGDATLVLPSDWNAAHSISNFVHALSANTSLAWGTHETVYVDAGAADKTITLPTAVGNTGCRFRIMRTNSTAGNVIIATTSAQTINGGSGYTLFNQYQYITVESDGANWFMWGGN